MNWHRVMILTVAFVLGLGMNAWAGAPTDQVRSYTDQVLKVLEDPALTQLQRREAVRSLAAEAFDTTETAQRALGVHWQQRTPAEREQFVKLFANLLEQTYVSRIDEYGGEHVEYVGEQVDGDKATVRARIITSKGTEVAVESRVIQKGDRWLIYDILIENLSLISNYRSQFDRVIRTSSYGELVKRLQARVVALNEKDAKMPRGAAQTPR
jgi:phospholipid transport system substrate-binding protein